MKRSGLIHALLFSLAALVILLGSPRTTTLAAGSGDPVPTPIFTIVRPVVEPFASTGGW